MDTPECLSIFMHPITIKPPQYFFTNAVSEYKLPSIVRCNKGGGNFDVGSCLFNFTQHKINWLQM